MRDYGKELKQKLEEIEQLRDEDYPGQVNEYRRNAIVRMAVDAADAIIMEGSDGSVEETDYLTSAVAQEFVRKVHIANSSKLMRKELLDSLEKRKKRNGEETQSV